jgi:hypothetical protein
LGEDNIIFQKSIEELKGLGCSKTFIHDGESYQLMTINAVYSKHTRKMTKFNYMEILQILIPIKRPGRLENLEKGAVILSFLFK